MRFECLVLGQTYPRPLRKTQEGKPSSFDWRHDGKSRGKHRETYNQQLRIHVGTFQISGGKWKHSLEMNVILFADYQASVL